MKRLFIIAFLLVGAMSVNAQIDLSNILGKVADAVTGKKELTAESIVGTWTYKKPALILESDNALKKLGGTVASGTIENKLATYYKKIGITEGSLIFTFNENNTFKATVKKKNISGTWSIDNGKVKLIVAKIAPVNVTTALSGNNLQMVFNSTFLLKLASGVGSKLGNSTVQAISKIANSYDGMELGMEFAK